MELGDYIRHLRKEAGLSQEELGKLVGVKRAAVNKWELGEVKNLKREIIFKMAEVFNVAPSSFIETYEGDWELPVQLATYKVPIFESVSAGFGTTANDYIVDYTALPFRSKSEAEQTICIKVKGDSMSPKIEDGDLIQVFKQSSVDSGDIAVVLLDGDNGLVKKVEYTDDSIRLVSLNLNYAPIVLQGRDVLRVQVLGKVKKIIREV